MTHLAYIWHALVTDLAFGGTFPPLDLFIRYLVGSAISDQNAYAEKYTHARSIGDASNSIRNCYTFRYTLFLANMAKYNRQVPEEFLEAAKIVNRCGDLAFKYLQNHLDLYHW